MAILELSAKKKRKMIGDVNVRLVSDRTIHRFNRQYLAHDYATDVLAFEAAEEGVLGDVMVSVDTAKIQAAELGHSLNKEVVILILHGILHLLGYRDKTAREKKQMWDKTNELLGAIQLL